MNNDFELVIVGAGPIGIACALEAKKAGIHYCIIEKGCLVNSLYNYPLNMTFFSTSERLEIGEIPFVSNNVKPTRPEALEYYRRVATSNHLNIHLQEEVLDIKQVNEKYEIDTTNQRYNTSYVILATGFYDIPLMMNIPGESLPKVKHYYRDPHFYAMQHVVVTGANNSAVDAALETYRKGAHVTMVIRSEKIGDRVKYWVRPDIENRIKEGSIKAYFNSCLKEVRHQAVDIQTPDGIITIKNDFVLAMTGYRPNFEFLQKVGIALSEDGICQPQHDPESMESNLKNVYLAGVICGGMNTHVWFIENSREHAVRIVNHIIDKKIDSGISNISA